MDNALDAGDCRFAACAIFKHFSGFEFFLLPRRIRAHPSASNANRKAAARVAFKRMIKNTPVSPSRHLHPTLIAVSVLFASLVIAYGLDSIFGLLRQQAQSTFHVIPAELFATTMPLIMATIMLALAWIILIKLPPSRAIATIFLAAGCLVIGTYLSQFTGFPVELRRTFIGYFRTAILTMGRHSSLYHLAAFWIIVGLACFFQQHIKTKASHIEM